MEEIVSVVLPHSSYDILVSAGCLQHCGEHVYRVAPHERAALLADANVLAAHGDVVQQSLIKAGFNTYTKAFQSGEEQKSVDTVSNLYTALLENKLERKSPICAFGGGVAGDLVGFVAATYLRGVPFIQIPTTLLAMVDASVGGKVAYNHPLGKNLIGAFYQPDLVLIDPEVLSTLPEREFRCGLAECIKHGVIGDAPLFDWTVENIDKIVQQDVPTLVELVTRNVQFKAKIVVEDEKEQGVRALLNLGHTFAHAIEATAGYGTYLHGEAVAIGMCAAAWLAADLGMCDASVLEKLESIFLRIGLPTKGNLVASDQLIEAMTHDKKVQDGAIRLILPTAIGACTITSDIPQQKIATAWTKVSN